MEQIRPFPPTDLIDQAEEEEAIRLAPAVELKDWVIQNFLTLGGELHNPDHDHIAELIHDDETFLAFAWASSACMAKKRMVLCQCEKVMFTDGQRSIDLLDQKQVNELIQSSDTPEALAFNLMKLMPSASESQFTANLEMALYAADVLGYVTASGDK